MDELAACVQRVTFDMFDKAHGAEWRNVKAAFDARNELVGGVTKELINTSFRRGSETQEPPNHKPWTSNLNGPCTCVACPLSMQTLTL